MTFRVAFKVDYYLSIPDNVYFGHRSLGVHPGRNFMGDAFFSIFRIIAENFSSVGRVFLICYLDIQN